MRGDEAGSRRNIVAALSPDVELLRTDDGSGRVAGGNLAADAFPDWLLDDRAPSSDQPVDASGYIHYRRLTPNQLRDVDNLLKYLEHRGHEMCRANKASEAARVEAQAAAGAAPMLELKAKRIAPEGGVREKGLRLKDGFLAEMDNLRSTFIRADAYSNISVDGKAGFNETNLLRPLLEGENKKRLLWGDEAEKLTPLLERIAGSIAAANARYGERLGGLKRRDGAALHVPAKMRNKRRSWTMERVFGMALQLGNASNTARLRSGFPDLDMETVAVLLGDEAARRVFSGDDGPSFNPLEANGRNEGLLTAEDWKAVQAGWDAVNALWPETEATHRALFGFAPKKVEATPLRLSVGGETLFLSGGYFPAKYDPRLSEKMAGKQEREDILRGETTQYAAPSAKRGHTKARAEQAPGEALRLDLGQMLEHIDEAVTFIALGPAVRHVDRVTQAPVWKNAYVRAFGEEEYKAIRENLKGMVGKQRNETAGQDAADIARRFLTYSALSWNMNTVVMQLDALGKSMADQGAAPVLRGLGKLVSGNPAKLIREIEAASPYMESRSKTIDRDLRKQAVDMSKLVKAKESRLSMAGMAFTVEQVAELGMVPMQVMDQLVSAAVWLGAYQKRMRELGAEAKGIEANSARHEQAVAHADMMVKRANPDWDGTSRTKFQRNPGYNMLNMFAGAATLVFQRQRMQYQVLRAGKATAAQYARFQAYDTLLPAAAFWLFAEACVAAFGDDEKKKERDKKPWQRRALEGLADYASPAVPVAGPLASSFFIGGMQSSGRGVWDKPLRLAGKTVGTTRKLISGEPVKGKKVTAADEALVLLDLAGFAARIPTRRIGTYGENVSNLLENPGR